MATDIIQLGGPHLILCKCGCGIDFLGRRNKKYFDDKHKAKVNNERRALRIGSLTEIFSEMSNNLRILIKYYPRSNGNAITYSPLLKEGFNPNAPCVMRKDVKTGIEYRALTNYYFRQSEDNKLIIIYKISHENNTK